MMRATRVTGFALAVAACGRSGEPRKASGNVSTISGDIAAHPLTAIELARFAALPTVMAPPRMERTPAQIALGRRLFHEPVLSNGHDLSCNTCHSLNGYGADGRKVSFGDLGHAGDRNAPSVYNAAGQFAQFWDGRSPNVEEQAKGPILNPHEMAMPDSGAVLAHMRESADYRAAFHAAFPNEPDPLNYDNVGKAIGAFERGLVTPSRWDRYLSGDRNALSPDELRGLAAFVRVGCANCHSGPYVGGQMFQKLGVVKPWPTSTDSGRYKVTKKPADLFVFKVPSLRNVEKTGPYFHDGSVASLDEAIRLMGRHQLGVELTDAQVRDIHTWLSSLTGELPAAYIAEPQQPNARR
jgi:cytochrome c peroxidase